MVMEGLLWLLIIAIVAYGFLDTFVYKRTKSYKEKQIMSLVQEADQLLSNADPNLENTQATLDRLITRKEQAKFLKELSEKDDHEKSEMIKKLMQPTESNMTNKAIAHRIMLILDKFKGAKFKYIRLMERLKYGSVDDRLKVTQDWNYYIKLFVDETSADPSTFLQVWVVLEEIENRFDEKLKKHLVIEN